MIVINMLWGAIVFLFLFFFYFYLIFILLYLSLSFFLKQLATIIPPFEFTKKVSALLQLTIIFIASGGSIYLIFHDAHVVKPFKAKLFKYPVTEVIITTPNRFSSIEQERVEKVLLKSFSKEEKRVFEGGYTFGRGNVKTKHLNGYLSHYWKKEHNRLHLFLSKPLSLQKIERYRDAISSKVLSVEFINREFSPFYDEVKEL